MGFWSGLASLGGIAAAPFTGGASLALVGRGASAASQGMANNRASQAELALDANEQFERALLARELEKRNARNDALRQSVFGSLLANYQPSGLGAPGRVSPFNLGNTGTSALTLASQDALSRLQNPNALPAMTDPRTLVAKYGKSGFWEKLLGVGGAIASAAGAGQTGSNPYVKY